MLNEKQEKFAQAYVLHRNATEAAKLLDMLLHQLIIRAIAYFKVKK